MKYQELTFQMIWLAILRRWKTMVAIFLIFLALGTASGFVFGHRASAEGAGSADQWEPVNFDSIMLDLMYYNSCYSELSKQSDYLYTYVDTVQLDTTITKEQSQQLLSLREEITKYQQEVLLGLDEALNDANMLYVPDQLRQEALKEYTRLRNSTQQRMIQAENAKSLLESIGGLTSTNEDINATYSTLLSEAAQYGQLQLDLEWYEKMLGKLENDYVQVRADSQEMASWLEQSAEELNELGQACYQAVEEIALENHLDVTTSVSEDELTVLIDHTNRPVTQQEAFSAFVLFFALVGICVGAFFALCREYADHKKDSTAQQ